MLTADLSFDYPKSLIATEKKPISRVMLVDKADPIEVTTSYILTQMAPEDVLVINDTKVIKARLHCKEGMEILFINEVEENVWEVLCPAKKWPKNQALNLPNGVRVELVESGRPQKVRVSVPLSFNYFEKYGDLPLPPYIQEARGERKAREGDDQMYQTAWAKNRGSLAAPTASLHFTERDLQKVQARGASVCKLSLHVGLGTFLPIQSEKTVDHKMHSENVFIPHETLEAILQAKKRGGRVWALGSTVTRALEAQAQDHLSISEEGFSGATNLFIEPGYEFKVVDVLMTNFHQPQTTLLAMVMAFAGQKKVKDCYKWAVDRQFRLFSYGDLSVWSK